MTKRRRRGKITARPPTVSLRFLSPAHIYIYFSPTERRTRRFYIIIYPYAYELCADRVALIIYNAPAYTRRILTGLFLPRPLLSTPSKDALKFTTPVERDADVLLYDSSVAYCTRRRSRCLRLAHTDFIHFEDKKFPFLPWRVSMGRGRRGT